DTLYSRIKLLSMKLSLILMFTGIFHVSAFTFGQKITLQKKNEQLGNILKEIQKQSGYNILYDSSLIPATLLVDINVTNQNLNSTLNAVLDKHNLGYKIMDKNIILNHKKVIASAPTTQTTPGQQ